MAEEARPNHLEQVLQAARERGRWLSDEEQQEQDQQQQQAQLQKEQQLSRRRRLTLLTAICVLLPPLWPLALDSVFISCFLRPLRVLAWWLGLLCCWGDWLLTVALVAGLLGSCCRCCSEPRPIPLGWLRCVK